MEKHISNKLLKGLFALSAGFLLASCDPVHALPENHAESIVVNVDGSSIDSKDNDLLQIYNLVESGKNEEALNIILRRVAEKKFGTYADFLAAKGDSAPYIAAHKDYFGEDEHTADRFADFVKDIDERISEAFYNEITSGSYNDQDGMFSELKLYNSKIYDLYDLDAASDVVKKNKFYVTKDVTKENAFSKLVGKYYTTVEGGRGYIEEKIYPEIIKNKIVEAYIYDNNASSLGRAYARKIDYIKVSYEDNFEDLRVMLKAFADQYIEDAKGQLDFEIVSGAVKGYSSFDEKGAKLVDAVTKDHESKVYKLLKDTYGVEDTSENGNCVKIDADITYLDAAHVLVPAGDYYKETKLGKILVSYKSAEKAEKDGRFATDKDKAELDKFTGEGKSKEYGLKQKLLSLAKEDYTTDGWFLKNGGATELPSAIRDRLFNIKVANTLDSSKLVEETKDTLGTYDKDNYLRNINDNKLVLPQGAEDYYGKDSEGVEQGPHYNYIYHDVDGKAFYICRVLEAPSTSKFNEKSDQYYNDALRVERLKRSVAKILGTKDSYIKDAYTDILKDYEDYRFFDTSLFDYLNAEYPDLDLDENDD